MKMFSKLRCLYSIGIFIGLNVVFIVGYVLAIKFDFYYGPVKRLFAPGIGGVIFALIIAVLYYEDYVKRNG